jgi:hypothetical protein
MCAATYRLLGTSALSMAHMRHASGGKISIVSTGTDDGTEEQHSNKVYSIS